jgi:hypothetical protein
MAIVVPDRTAGSLGTTKSDANPITNEPQQLTAAQYNLLADKLIEVINQSNARTGQVLNTSGLGSSLSPNIRYVWPASGSFNAPSIWNVNVGPAADPTPSLTALSSQGPFVLADGNFGGGRVKHINFAAPAATWTYEAWRVAPTTGTGAGTITKLATATIVDGGTNGAQTNGQFVLEPSVTILEGDTIVLTLWHDAGAVAGARVAVTVFW